REYSKIKKHCSFLVYIKIYVVRCQPKVHRLNLNMVYGVGLCALQFPCTQYWLPIGMLANQLNILGNSIILTWQLVDLDAQHT
ncbi:hypothetical protein MXB_2917, partial [Myxobolus squamalis]